MKVEKALRLCADLHADRLIELAQLPREDLP